VAINCAAIPPSLQESELFGHERGAYTGATSSRRGAFEQAHNGTLFLDEAGEMSPETQAILLRVLEAKAVRRLGGSSETPVNVRIISATSRDLESEVKAGRFRKDLFYRLVVYPIHLPPLRERASDIPLLVEQFIGKLRDSLRVEVERFHPEALEALRRHDWPGNVRELQNVVSRAMVVCDGPEVGLSHLPVELAALLAPKGSTAATPAKPASASVLQLFAPQEKVLPLRELERQAILQALRVTQGNVPKAAQMLEIGRATLYRRIADQQIRLESPLDAAAE
jgi:DNA-binding NtrC family response regulator